MFHFFITVLYWTERQGSIVAFSVMNFSEAYASFQKRELLRFIRFLSCINSWLHSIFGDHYSNHYRVVLLTSFFHFDLLWSFQSIWILTLNIDNKLVKLVWKFYKLCMLPNILKSFYMMRVKFYKHENLTAAWIVFFFTQFFHVRCKIWMQQTYLNFYKIFQAACQMFRAQSQILRASKILSPWWSLFFTDFVLYPLKDFICSRCFSLSKNWTF